MGRPAAYPRSTGSRSSVDSGAALYVGLMSGASLDGVDAVLIAFDPRDRDADCATSGTRTRKN